MTPTDPAEALRLQDAFGRVEDAFNHELDKSLAPRGPGFLYDLVAELNFGANSLAVDVGSGEGQHAIELAKRFGLQVVGIEPLDRHIEIARRAAKAEVSVAGRVRFRRGAAERIPLEDACADLVWCRDVLSLVVDVRAVFEETRRILKPGGYAVVYSMCVTEELGERDAAFLLPSLACVRESMQPAVIEAAIEAAGLSVVATHVLGSEWGEYGQEQSGRGASKLIRAARLLRDPGRYIAQFGDDNYKIALADNLWHVYRLIGKLSDRVYVLSNPGVTAKRHARAARNAAEPKGKDDAGIG